MALYEKFWDCPACGTKGISALRKLKCPNCGHTKSPQDKEHRSNIEITDEDGIALARGGPHWTCSSCGSVNLDKYTMCTSCNNPREKSDKANRIVELGSTPPPAYQPPDPAEQWYQPEREEPHETEPKPTYQRYQTPTNYDSVGNWLSGLPWLYIIIGLVVVIGIITLGWAIFHTVDVQAQVTGFSWSRDVTIERYRTVHESGWSHPSDAYNLRSEMRIRSYEPIYETRTKVVHHSQTCYRDLGNGAEQSYDCSYDTTETYQETIGQRPVYDTWYEYDLDTWCYERTAHAGGNDKEKVNWPQFELYLDGQTVIGAERVGGRSETYSVHFRSEGKKGPEDYVYSTSQDDWMKYQAEINYPLKVNSFKIIMNNPLQDKEKNKAK